MAVADLRLNQIVPYDKNVPVRVAIKQNRTERIRTEQKRTEHKKGKEKREDNRVEKRRMSKSLALL